MHHFRLLYLWLPVLILFTTTATVAGQETQPEPAYENVDKLVELLYSLEDFQTRLANALENNLSFGDHANDAYFLRVLTRNVRETAANTYGESIGQATLNLSQPEVDTLIAALESPYGDVIRKMFNLDNAEVERDLAAYVNTLVGDAMGSLTVRDSLFFEKEYPFELKQVMSGTYTNTIGPGKVIEVERTQSSQKESFEGKVFELQVKWLTNSKYSLTSSTVPATEVIANLYAIDDNAYKYIFRLSDGTYRKHELLRTGFESYADEVKAFRWSLYDKYADAFTSPLKADEIVSFKNEGGHTFYEVSDDFRVTAQVERETDDSKTITLATSDDREKTYRVYGKALFMINGKQESLDLYEPVRETDSADESRLFLPFRDLTSGKSSYGGGRYIDLGVPAGDELVIDFNKSYNPYCAYTDGYSCPIPPEENTLSVAIAAGIKAPKPK